MAADAIFSLAEVQKLLELASESTSFKRTALLQHVEHAFARVQVLTASVCALQSPQPQGYLFGMLLLYSVSPQSWQALLKELLYLLSVCQAAKGCVMLLTTRWRGASLLSWAWHQMARPAAVALSQHGQSSYKTAPRLHKTSLV
jgi:hypothetical protein